MLAELQGTSVAKAGAATESGTSRMSALMKRNFITGAYGTRGDQECEAVVSLSRSGIMHARA
jgi:hypothetical protein